MPPGSIAQFASLGSAPRVDLFLSKDNVVRMGVPPMRIEILTSISGVEFEACYAEREMLQIEGHIRAGNQLRPVAREQGYSREGQRSRRSREPASSDGGCLAAPGSGQTFFRTISSITLATNSFAPPRHWEMIWMSIAGFPACRALWQ